NIELLTLLLDAGANPNPVTPNRASPLELLCRGWMSGNGSPEAIKLLVERGARPGDVFQKTESWDRNKGAFSEAWRESFRAVWRASHWRDNPRLGHAVWISQGESLPVLGRMPLFAAVLTDESAVSRPPTLREFFSLAPDFVSRHAKDEMASGLQSDWEGVSVIRMQDGKEERIPVNMVELAARPEGQDMALLWGDVVELPVKNKTDGREEKQSERMNQWIYAPMPVEVRVEAGPGRFVTNSSQESGTSFHANARDRANIRPGRPVPVVRTPEILRGAGATNLLFSRSEVIRTSPSGALEPAETGLHHGDIFRVKGPAPEAKITEENQYSAAWVCQNPEGPFWRVPVPKSINGKPVPLAGLMVALLGPHPLPSACFDWDKATVRYLVQSQKKENPKKTETANTSGWTEKKLLEAWPGLTLEQGMTITLPPAERDSFEPPAKLRAALTSALTFEWTLAVGDQPEVECRYEPRFFRGEKKEGIWIWRDLDPKKAAGPVLPVVEELVAGNPRSGYPLRNSNFSISWLDEVKKTDHIETGRIEAAAKWLLHDGAKVSMVVNAP
ncbi:MAG TPA: hypothetical protein VHM91_19040, partial [Verrucomicrobiales bacterium]|nr:hypothetical protein [Verrucomicrobiales bacterium]